MYGTAGPYMMCLCVWMWICPQRPLPLRHAMPAGMDVADNCDCQRPRRGGGAAASDALRDSNTPKWPQENPALDLLYLSRPRDLGGWAVVGWNIRCEFLVVHFFESSNSEKPLDLTTSIWGPGRPAQAVSTPGSVHSREHRHPREAF